MRNLITITIVIFLILIGISPVRASNSLGWPMFHGDAARTGFSESKVPSSPKVLWEITVSQLREFGVNDFEVQRPIIDQGKVFFASSQVFAADLNSGEIIWNYKGDRPDFYPSFLAAGDGRVFVTVTNSNKLKNMSEGFIYALDENDGRFLWKYQTQKQISHPSPVLAEGKVFIGDESGAIYAIETNTGNLVWKRQLEALWIHSSPAYKLGIIYVGTETSDTGDGKTGKGSFLYALDAKDGRVLWRFESDWRGYDMANFIHGTPAILEDTVYFGVENGWFYALNKDSGKVIWKKIITKGTRTAAREAAGTGLVGVSTAPALGYGKIFVGTWEGNFVALDQKDGTTIWEYNYGNEGTDSSAVLADGKVCFGSHYLDFYCFNEKNGKVIWKEKLGGPSTALSSGILVVPNDLAAAESPGSILVAFSDKGTSGAFGPVKAKNISFEQYYPLAFVLVMAIILAIVIFWLLKFKRITLKKFLIIEQIAIGYAQFQRLRAKRAGFILDGIFLSIIILGIFVYSHYSQLQKTGLQTQLQKEGKIDQATGSFIDKDEPAKYIEYQAKKYFLDGSYCFKSGLLRFAVSVKRVNGAAAANGSDGNTMYAVGEKNNPTYIDSSKTNDSKSDCWRQKSP